MKGFVTKTQITADKNGNFPTSINLLKAGTWNTPWHGGFELNSVDLEEMEVGQLLEAGTAQERKPEAEASAASTEAAEAKAKLLAEEAEKQLVKAKADADKIRSDAEAEAKKTVDAAKADADKIVKAAQEAAKNGAQTKPSAPSK